MKERSGDTHDNLKTISQGMEAAWRVVTYPHEYPPQVVQLANSQINKYKIKMVGEMLILVKQHILPEDLNKAYMGLYHYKKVGE